MKPRILVSLLLLVFLTACGTFEVGVQPAPTQAASAMPLATTPPTLTEAPTALPASETALPASETALPATETALPATDTSIPLTDTAIPPTETKRAPAATQGPKMVQIFLIALEDQGISGKPVGCGDSAVPVRVQIPPTQGVLKAALEALLSVRSQYYGESGLYNALYQSDLRVDSVTIKSGKATVKLSGTLLQGGECDSPRIVAQLEETVLQFSTVEEAQIFINGKPLEEVLSLK